MKALFCIASDQFIINDFKSNDLEFLMRIRSVKNRWRKEGEAIIQDSYFSNLEVLEDDDIKILGKNGNEKQWEEKFTEAQQVAEMRYAWYEAEKEKVKKLTEELNKFKEVPNGN